MTATAAAQSTATDSRMQWLGKGIGLLVLLIGGVWMLLPLVWMRFEVIVMDEDIEGFGDQLWGVLHELGMLLLQLMASLGREGALNRSFSQSAQLLGCLF